MGTHKFRKWKNILILLALVLSLVGFSLTPQAAFAQEDQTDQQQAQGAQPQTISMGNVGVFSPQGFNEDTFSISKVERREAGFAPVEFIKPLVRIESTVGSFPNVLTYVFFNVRPGSVERSNRSQGVSIWFRSEDSDRWEQCANTYIVNGSAASQVGMDVVLEGRDETRVACLVTRYNAVYGIGVPRDGSSD